MTILEKFLSHYANVPVDEYGIPESICVRFLGYDVPDCDMNYFAELDGFFKYYSPGELCQGCWNREIDSLT